MLIGYSVDTDVLLSTRLLKDKKDPYMSANKSLQTGITMTTTTLFVILAMLIISYYTQMLIILEIAVVLVCGLVGDLISTWFFNAPALISYVNKKKK
jgi:preprotein translocase subunit SecF